MTTEVLQGPAVVPTPRRKAGPEVWSEYGLVSLKRRDRGEKRGGPKVVPRERRFRQALEDRRGLFAIFGQFLAGRADLLPGSYLAELRGIKWSSDAGGAELLARETGGKVSAFQPMRA